MLVQIKVWNVRTGACETTISGHTDSVECVRWGGVGLLYTCSRDRTIKVWAIDGSGTQNSPILDASFQRSRATTLDDPSHTHGTPTPTPTSTYPGRSQHKLVRTLTGHAHRINYLALNCDYVLRTGAFQVSNGSPSPFRASLRALSLTSATTCCTGAFQVSNGSLRRGAVLVLGRTQQ